MTEDKKLTGYPSIDKPWLKYYSEEAINAKIPECTIYEYLWESNKNHLSDIALRYFENKISFRELFDNIEKAAKAFTAIGVKRGDIVVMATVTTPETVYAVYALNRLGVVPNMIDPRTSTEGIREYIREVDAKVVLTLDVAYHKIEKAIIGTNVYRVIVTSPADSLQLVKKTVFLFSERIRGNIYRFAKNCITWKCFIENGNSTEADDAPYEKDSCCVIVHTGGTTGLPKGVMLSNENINALVLQSILTGIDMKREHTWMDIMPPFIAYGIGMGLHLPLIIGMETILVPSFDAKKFDELLLKHKPIHMIGVPSYWGVIINSKKLAKKDLSFIIAPTVGGDTMNITLEKNANEFLKAHGCEYSITKGYGMTEVCAGVSGTVEKNNEVGSVGIPFCQTVISVFNPETDEELKYNEHGEICISGPNVMIGYYANQAATDDIKRVHKDGSVWIHSGDIGYMTENGSLYIVGRVKRIIVRYDGFKVFPSLIEKVVSTHKDVEVCCTVGTPDKEHSQGKLPVVFVVTNDVYNADVVRGELIELCQKELPEYMQPVDFVFIDKMPLTPIGKIDYRELEREVQK